MATLAELETVFSANIAPLAKSVKEMEGKVNKFTGGVKKGFGDSSKAVGGMGKSLSGLGDSVKNYIGGMTAALSATVAFSKVVTSLSSNAQLGRMADRLGITTQALAELTFVGSQFGIEADQVADSMKDLGDKIADAARNGAAYEESLNMIGLKSKELVNLPLDQQLQLVIDGMAGLDNAADKAFVSMDLMSDAGFAWISVANAGAGATEDLRKQFVELNQASDNAFRVASAQEYAKAVSRMQAAIDGAAGMVGEKLAPALIGVVDTITAMTMSTAKNEKAFETMATIAQVGATAVAGVWHGVTLILDGLNLAIVASGKLFTDMTGAVVRAVQTVAIRLQGVSELAGTIWEEAGRLWPKALDAMILVIKKFAANAAQILLSIIKPIGGLAATLNDDLQVAFVDFTSSAGAAIAQFKADTNKELRETDLSLQVSAQAAEATRKAFGELGETDFANAPLAGVSEQLNAVSESLGQQTNEAIQTFTANAMQFGEGGVVGMVDGLFAAARERIAALKQEVGEGEGEGDGKPDQANDPETLHKQAVADELKRIDKEQEDEEKANRVKRDTFYKSSLKNRLNVTKDILGNLSTLMQSENRKQFEVGKAAAIGQSLINTWQGATKAMAELPYPVNLAAAAATAAAGMINVQKIASTSFGGGGGGAAGGATSAPTAGGGGEAAPAAEQAPQVTQFDINLQNGGIYSAQQVDALIGAINDRTDDNVELRANVS